MVHVSLRSVCGGLSGANWMLVQSQFTAAEVPLLRCCIMCYTFQTLGTVIVTCPALEVAARVPDSCLVCVSPGSLAAMVSWLPPNASMADS